MSFSNFSYCKLSLSALFYFMLGHLGLESQGALYLGKVSRISGGALCLGRRHLYLGALNCSYIIYRSYLHTPCSHTRTYARTRAPVRAGQGKLCRASICFGVMAQIPFHIFNSVCFDISPFFCGSILSILMLWCELAFAFFPPVEHIRLGCHLSALPRVWCDDHFETLNSTQGAHGAHP